MERVAALWRGTLAPRAASSAALSFVAGMLGVIEGGEELTHLITRRGRPISATESMAALHLLLTSAVLPVLAVATPWLPAPAVGSLLTAVAILGAWCAGAAFGAQKFVPAELEWACRSQPWDNCASEVHSSPPVLIEHVSERIDRLVLSQLVITSLATAAAFLVMLEASTPLALMLRLQRQLGIADAAPTQVALRIAEVTVRALGDDSEGAGPLAVTQPLLLRHPGELSPGGTSEAHTGGPRIAARLPASSEDVEAGEAPPHDSQRTRAPQPENHRTTRKDPKHLIDIDRDHNHA